MCGTPPAAWSARPASWPACACPAERVHPAPSGRRSGHPCPMRAGGRRGHAGSVEPVIDPLDLAQQRLALDLGDEHAAAGEPVEITPGAVHVPGWLDGAGQRELLA